MPRKQTVERAKAELRQGKKPTTAAGEFVREEIEHVRQGKHGARSTKQAIAIGLSKARRAGVPLKPPEEGRAPERTRRSAKRDLETGQGKRKPRARRRDGDAPPPRRCAKSHTPPAHIAQSRSRQKPPRDADVRPGETEDCVKT